ncbi:type II secretion system protein N [Inmirania thermothiophila]|uniref:Type II secretion system protein N n=1 Tax=Inmirania thermothiophila TaxID=1750597 RepID=A0A3N1XTQ9_9GAMM|nr:type II secretion system protein N [Inmirania thermothiophila]ROR29561.1 type II secretion system protein N (GspN) [Inmirania thermothiophila]
MRRLLLRYLLPLAALYAVALAATLPAQVALERAAARWPVAAEAARGTVWRGEATGLEVGGIRLARLRWAPAPAALARGEAALQLAAELEGAVLDGRLGVTAAGRLRAGPVQLGAEAAALAGPLGLAALRPQGRIEADIEALELASLRPLRPRAARGRVLWRRARLAGEPLGELAADLRPTADGLEALVADRGGPLQVALAARLRADGGWTLRGRIAPRAGASPRLHRLLAGLGRPGPDGAVAVDLRGRLDGPAAARTGS